MRFFKPTITASKANDLWMENNNIPFKKKSVSNGVITYSECIVDKHNIRTINGGECINKINVEYHQEQPIIEDMYRIYSDGGSFNNGYKDSSLPMFGSTCTIITKNDKEIYRETNVFDDATNNACEVTAGLIGLRWLKENVEGNVNVILSSDSQYLMKGINEWMLGWIKRGWKNNEGEPVSNMVLWKEIHSFIYDKRFNIYTCWVRGHQADINSTVAQFNDECDRICNESINVKLESLGLPVRKIKKK